MKAIQSPFETDASETEYSDTVARLRAELDGASREPSGAAVGELVGDVEASVSGDASADFEFSESLVKSSLGELLLSLVALRTSDTHGKQLLDDLGTEFDTTLSPGTVYPKLHELCDEAVLEQRELVKTKEYTVADETEARARIAAAARQHLAFGLLFHATLEHGEFDADAGFGGL